MRTFLQARNRHFPPIDDYADQGFSDAWWRPRPDSPVLALDARNHVCPPLCSTSCTMRGVSSPYLPPQASDTARFITDKMPDNFRFIGMVKLMLPNARIIHCRRDPRDTCLSVFKSFFAAGIHDYAYDLSELGQYYNLYRDLMDHWHDVLPDFIYDVRYEDVISDQETRSRDLLAFCGLDWNDACLEFYNTDRPIRPQAPHRCAGRFTKIPFSYGGDMRNLYHHYLKYYDFL